LGINGSAMQGPMVVPNKSFSEIDDEKYDRWSNLGVKKYVG
jgi:hypothetical protein